MTSVVPLEPHCEAANKSVILIAFLKRKNMILDNAPHKVFLVGNFIYLGS